MSDTQTIDLSELGFSADAVANPTKDDIALWNSLSEAQKEAVILAEMDAAEQGGLAPKQSMAEIIAEARAERGHEL